MADEQKNKTPGLTTRKRKDRTVYYWIPSDKDYPLRTVPLGEDRDHAEIRARALHAEMKTWLATRPQRELNYDGTLGSVFMVYRTHPDSPFHKLKPGSMKPYKIYLGHLERALGKVAIASQTGIDVLRWHETWRGGKKGSKLAAAQVCLAIVKSALRFGVFCGFNDCARLLGIIEAGKFEKPKKRTAAPTAQQIVDARRAAHELGRPSVAFALAIQFEGAVRQWDVIGEWLPLSDPRPSAILDRDKKWIGPTWANIDEKMILTYTPTKTEETTAFRVHVDLSECPMVLEEIARIPNDRRIGPLIVSEETKLPYGHEAYRLWWRKAADKAGIPSTIWNRDLKAGGVTEGSRAGASLDDLSKLAAHSTPRTTAEVYDRDKLEAARRVSSARTAFRQKGDG